MGEFSKKEPFELKERIHFALWFALFAFFVLTARVFYLQIVNGFYFKELSKNNRIRVLKAHAPRGLVYDRNGELLSEARPAFDLYVMPEDIEDWQATKKTLLKIAAFDENDENEVEEKFRKKRPPYQPVRLREDLRWDEMARVAAYAYKLPGVSIEVGPKRLYSYRDATAHLIGYTGEIDEKEYAEINKNRNKRYAPGDEIGKYGVEGAFEEYLRGTDGGRQVEVDAEGRLIKVVESIEPHPGNIVRLTVDLKTQIAAHEAMRGKAGSVVAINPKNGKVIAMVSAPAFDPNSFSDGLTRGEWLDIVGNPLKPLNNRAIQAQYPPASTFKPILAAAALEEKVITPRTKIYAGPSFFFGGRHYRDWFEEGHGDITVHRAIVRSADTFFYQVGLKTGIDRIARYARKFGLGEKTDIEIKGEKGGLVPSSEWKKTALKEPWYEGETISIAVGQSYMLATPLQIAVAYAAIANGGTVYVPKVVERIETPEAEPLKEFVPEEKSKTGISEETLSIVKNALIGVVEDEGGTAGRLKALNLKIAGKTGTAQVVKLDRSGVKGNIPYNMRFHAWFVGFAPHDDPEIVVCALVEHGGMGGVEAVPVAYKVFEAYLAPEKQPLIEKVENQ